MLLIYTPHITNRIAFIMDVIFNKHLRITYRLTESIEDYKQASIKIVYAPQHVSVESEIYIWQHPLLIETDIRKQTIDHGLFEEEPIFFQSSHSQSFLPFDIFALAFYLLTRYEEYLPHPKDKYGRFPASESIAFKTGFLQKPLVDILVLKFAQKLQVVFPDLSFELPTATYIATYDIDNAYAYKHKGLIRTIGGLLKQFLRFDFKDVIKRLSVLTGKKQDPSDTYQYIESIRQKYNLENYFFILCAEKSRYDRGLNHQNKDFQKLIRQLRTKGSIGCHPSFASSFSSSKLTCEINNLSAIIKEKIRYSRSHYLLLDFPETYQKYVLNGMEIDFTLGYPELIGFRASTCKTFHFFDLSTNENTPLYLAPLAYMEATLQKYMQLKPDKALVLIKQLINAVKSVNGTFISLWHNESFEKNEKEDWKKIYEQSLVHFFTNP